MEPKVEATAERRVYRDEMSRRMGRSKEWIRELERRGAIPKARYDEGSRRGFWLESEVRQIIAGPPAPSAEQRAA